MSDSVSKSAPAAQGENPLISPTELRVLQLKGQDPLLVDVRSPAEYAAGHVAGAVNIPLDDLPARLDELPEEQPVVTYCMMKHPGQSRGERAAALLRAQGYAARTLNGGLPGWQAAGLPVETGEDAA